ncbi:DUF4440 domain-containing protein [Micromonospora sp. NPDC049048]|uniref:DUF4440 domain-containing protein n=1 Tax=Micromonospora sp. NPDC049048 TaxID=3364263 RepID=UPI00371CE146
MDLLTAERQLQAAQRAADVESLDALLHLQAVGAGPDGTVFSDRITLIAIWWNGR